MGKILNFLILWARIFKFAGDVVLRFLITYLMENYDLGAPFLAQSPQSVKILTSSFFEVDPSNLYNMFLMKP